MYAVRSLGKASSVEFQMIFDSLFLIGAATVSYHLIEKPIRRYGLRGAIQNLFGPPHPVSPSTPAVVPEQVAETPEEKSAKAESSD
jgi:peptidoglycan/LPS O-acetylase OafA/YrhL